MALKSYEDLKKLDLNKYITKRDGADYINWARIVDLLHENGAGTVYFEPVVNELTGSSLFMTEQSFETGKDKITNRVYETAVRIVIDDLDFIMRGPVMNGGNPVRDNSMTQQRLWNSQCRLFVKGVAIRTGLGFNLWLQDEENEEKNNWEDDLNKHNIFKIQERMQQLVSTKMKQGLSKSDIARKLNISEEELNMYLTTYFKILDKLEKRISEMKADD